MKTPPSQIPDLVDQAFMDARHKLLDLAAFLDRVERYQQQDDFRVAALYKAIECLQGADGVTRTEAIQLLLSDPSTDPIPAAHTKGATGAWCSEMPS